jgi:hypothetical protein
MPMIKRNLLAVSLVTMLLLLGGALMLYGKSNQQFPSAFVAEAVHRWQAADEANIDISDLAQQQFKPGMSISECGAVFLLLGLKEGPVHGPPTKDSISMVGYYGWSSTKFTLFPEAVLSVGLYFSDDKLQRTRAQIIANRY